MLSPVHGSHLGRRGGEMLPLVLSRYHLLESKPKTKSYWDPTLQSPMLLTLAMLLKIRAQITTRACNATLSLKMGKQLDTDSSTFNLTKL